MANDDFGVDIITLIDDEGQEREFEIVDTLEHNGEHYIALIGAYDDPNEQLQDDDELIILKSVMDGDEEFLEAIEDEAEFDEVAEIFVERLEEDFEFIEDEDTPIS